MLINTAWLPGLVFKVLLSEESDISRPGTVTRAMILEAEGKKEAMIREAEGKLEAAKKEAEAQIMLAEASAKAIQDIAVAVGDKELPALFLLGDRYVNAIQKLSTSPNTKNFVLPADILGAVKGIAGRSV